MEGISFSSSGGDSGKKDKHRHKDKHRDKDQKRREKEERKLQKKREKEERRKRARDEPADDEYVERPVRDDPDSGPDEQSETTTTAKTDADDPFYADGSAAGPERPGLGAGVEQPAKLVRDSWMLAKPKPKRPKEEKPPVEEKSKDEEEEPRVGLIYMKGGAQPPPADAPGRHRTKVGDGGIEWKLKGLRRAREKAKETGKSLREVWTSTFGTLEELDQCQRWERRNPRLARIAQGEESGARSHNPDGLKAKRAHGGDRGEQRAYLRDELRSNVRRPAEGIHWQSRSGEARRAADDRRRAGATRHRGRDDAREGRDRGDRGDRGGRGDAREGRDRDHGRGDRGREHGKDRSDTTGAEHRGDGGGRASPGGAGGEPAGRGEGVRAQGRGSRADGAVDSTGATPPGDTDDKESRAREAALKSRLGASNASAGQQAPTAAAAPAAPPSSAAVPDAPADRNKLMAAALRAELMGDTEKAARLREQVSSLDAAHGPLATPASRPAGPQGGRPGPSQVQAGANQAREDVVVLPEVDSRGRRIDMTLVREAEEEGQQERGRNDLPGGRRRRNKPGTAAVADKEKRMEEMSVEEMMRREKESANRRGGDWAIARNIARSSRFKYSAQGFDDDDGMGEQDDGAAMRRMAEDRDEHMSRKEAAEKERRRAIHEANLQRRTENTCGMCWKGTRLNKSLVIALGERTLLMLPPRGAIVPGHCLIVPIEHTAAVTDADEDVVTEIRNFQKCITRMFAVDGTEPVFMEYAVGRRGHTSIECVPLPPEAANDAPIFFQKTLNEADEEWSAQGSKKVMKTDGKGIRRTVPEGFDYFHVEFGLKGGGMAHIVEDVEKFPRSLGRDVLLGLLGLPPDRMNRKKVNHKEMAQRVKTFAEKWKPHDWTAQLDGGGYAE